MKRLVSVLTLILLTLTSVAVSAPTALADDHPQWRIPRFDVAAEVDQTGLTTVTLDFDFNFGTDSGHGPYLWLAERQGVAEDPGLWRMLNVTVKSVTSRTGAPTNVETSHENGSLVLRIGDPNRGDLTGVHRYVLVYTIRGLIAPKVASSGMDEFNWSAIGTGWTVPIDKASVVVTTPAIVKRAACFKGAEFDKPCSASQVGATATFKSTSLSPGEGMQVVAGVSAGTFTGAEPKFEKRYWAGNVVPLTPISGGLTALLAALGVTGVLMATRRAVRDEAYIGLTPGLSPAPGQQAAVGPATDVPVTVQFTPPQGARPGEIGTLVDATAGNEDVTATIIDLAVRGHMRITELPDKKWRFIQTTKAEQLTAVEQHLLSTLFKAGPEVTTEELANHAYSDLVTGARRSLYDRVTNELRWFRARPTTSRGAAVMFGVLFILGGALLGGALGLTMGLGLVGLAPIIVGLLIIALNNRFPRRTAEGSAVLAQAKGFELYLRTAEADQIRFEESIDVFSRYLPFAIVFGVADRWAAIFQKLAAEGRYNSDTSWYVGPSGYFYASSFGHSVNSLASSLSASMTTSTVSSSGSGFSGGGGGGFGGGGGGGW